MTITYREAGEGSSVEMVQEAQRSFIRANRLMERVLEQWEDGHWDNPDEFTKVYDRFRRDFHTALKERERLENERAKRDGIADGKSYALDFDKARHEIGRRLACLADTGGAGEISG